MNRRLSPRQKVKEAIMRLPILILSLLAIFIGATASAATHAQNEKKDYLSEGEADKIRDAPLPPDRIRLFVLFADDRLKKFQYELNRTAPEGRRAEILNSLLNAYAGCMDDAADQIALAQEKQIDIRVPLKLMQTKGKEFLEILQKRDSNAA